MKDILVGFYLFQLRNSGVVSHILEKVFQHFDTETIEGNPLYGDPINTM